MRGGSAIALAEAGAPVPRRRAVVGELPSGPKRSSSCAISSCDPWQRHAMSSHTCTTRGGRGSSAKQRVERRDAVRVRGRHGQPAADLVQPARADPADPLLQRPERRQQQMPPRARRVTARGRVAGGPGRGARRPPSPTPAGRARRRAPRVRRRRLGAGDEADVHLPAGLRRLALARAVSTRADSSFSTRIAAALNSAVPDFGSVASIVSWFTSTSSGKWNVMNASPARSESSIRTGASTAPRRDDDANDLALGHARAARRPPARGRATRRDAAASGSGSTGRPC